MSPQPSRRFDPCTGKTFQHKVCASPQQDRAEHKSGEEQEEESDSSGLGPLALFGFTPWVLCFASWYTGYKWYIEP